MAVAGGLVMLGLVAFLFRAPPGGVRPVKILSRPPPAGPVSLVNLRENEAALTDPTPLFLPTKWNAGQNALPANAQREPDTVFAGYPAKLKYAENELGLDFPADIAVPMAPAHALSSGKPDQMFIGLDYGNNELKQLIERKGFVEITTAKNGRRVLVQSLADARPPEGKGWQPMEFLVAVDPMGLVGPPILTESSRVTAVDGYFQNYLVKTLRAGERLSPGFYRICVGP